MQVVLWDTRRNDAQKDFAGGMGVGMYPGRGGVRGRIVRRWYQRDYRPPAMNFAYLGAIFRQLGHTVEYVEDRLPRADIYVFNPSLLTLNAEIAAMQSLHQRSQGTRILVVGQVAHAMPQAFAEVPNATVVQGEPEQLLWKFDEVLDANEQVVSLGSVADLDDLPFPDWSLFEYRKFKIKYDFWRFPTSFVQLSRGCTFTCNYCPYIIVENKTRFRDPEHVVAEIQHGMDRYGFRSFKFRDPLFGLNRRKALEVAEGIRRLPKKIQFSIEGRIDLLREDTLVALKKAGLTSITVGIETPDEETLRHHKRAPIDDDRQREFVQMARRHGIRTVAGFMVGFPHDTEKSILGVLNYARKVNPTYANFNVVTPYPGTEFYEQSKSQIADLDYTNYSVFNPVMKYEHLSAEQVAELHGRCMTKYYFRSRYLKENGHLLWPFLQKLGIRLSRTQAIPKPPAIKDSELLILDVEDNHSRSHAA